MREGLLKRSIVLLLLLLLFICMLLLLCFILSEEEWRSRGFLRDCRPATLWAARVPAPIAPPGTNRDTANLRTKILDVRGFDSNIILNSRGGILMSMGNFMEILSQQILVGVILVGRLGVLTRVCHGGWDSRIRAHVMCVASWPHTGVCEKTLLRRRIHVKLLVSRTPNRGLESSFCCWTAGQGLAQKECLFHRHQYETILSIHDNIIEHDTTGSSNAPGHEMT